jgi:glycerol-3-phosphate dehydrogenase
MPQINLDAHRAAAIDRLIEQPLDVLVVGGGIVGAGVARDAALRGLCVGMVEQHDLAFGTSSRSSRLLHGGLRYLAQGRIRLVHEASREKRILHRIAPQLAEPLAFVFPAYRGDWPLWKLRLGVKLYDLLCGGRNLGRSTALSRVDTAANLPGVNTEGLAGAVRYFDGLTNDAGLVIDTLRSASAAGATVMNYVRLEDATPGSHGWECRMADLLAGRSFSVTTRTVVNATGPWSPRVPHSSIRLRLTKGVHLVIDRGRLPLPDAMVMTEGNRILFAIPWGHRMILGTTDTDYDGPIEAVRTEPAEINYILGVVNRAFPSAKLAPDDVRATWAGLRPLVADTRGRPSDISRAHVIRMPESGWIDVAGGKLTTYRLIAEQVIDRALAHLGRQAVPCRTAEEPLLVPSNATGQGSTILPPPVSFDVVDDCCEHRWAVHLDDVMTRRTGWHYYEDDPARIAELVAQRMATVFGWDAERTEAELARYHGAAR